MLPVVMYFLPKTVQYTALQIRGSNHIYFISPLKFVVGTPKKFLTSNECPQHIFLQNHIYGSSTISIAMNTLAKKEYIYNIYLGKASFVNQEKSGIFL